MLSKNKFIILLLLIFILTLLYIFYICFKNEYINVEFIKQVIIDNKEFGAYIFIAIFIIASLIFLPISPFSIIGGSIFGPFYATVFVIIGSTIGSLIAFTFSNYLGEKYIHNIIHKKYKQIDKLDHYLQKRGFIPVVIVRLIPVLPFAFLNYLLGITKIKLQDFILGTVIGLLIPTIIYTYFGHSLKNLTFLNTIISVSLIAILLIATKIYKKNKFIKENNKI